MKKRLLLFLLSFLLGGCATRQAAQAQFIGQVGLQNHREVALSAVTVATASAIVRNIGQSAHQVHYTVTGGTPLQVEIIIEGSEDGTTFFQISEVGTSRIEGVIIARGFYPAIRVNLRAYNAGGSTLTAIYSGTQTTGGEPQGLETSGVFLVTLGTALDGTATQSFNFNPRKGRTGGFLVFEWAGQCTSEPIVPFLEVFAAVSPTSTVASDLIALQPVHEDGTLRTTIVAVTDRPTLAMLVTFEPGGSTCTNTDFSLFYIFSENDRPVLSVPEARNANSFSFSRQTATGSSRGVLVGPWAVKNHTVQLNVTGGPTTCTFELEGSLDAEQGASGGTWFGMSGPITCTSSIMFHIVDRLVQWVRPNLTALSGGAAPTVTTFYIGSN